MVGDREQETPGVQKGARLHHFFDTVNASTAALSLEGILLSASPRFAEMLKKPREELIGTPFEQFVAPQERSRFQRLLTQSNAVRGSSGEVILRRSDDESLYAHLALRRLRRPFPDVILLLCVDTTHHHHTAERLGRERAELAAQVEERTAELAASNNALQAAHRALAVEHAVLQSALEQLPDALIIVDTERHILLANSAARQLGDLMPSGLSPDPAQHALQRLFDLDGRPIDPDHVPILKALRGEPCLGQDIRVVHPNGEERTYLVNALPLFDDTKHIVGVISNAADVTHLRQPDAALPASLLLREMRHRFRNNLAFLSSLLGLQSDSVTSEEARKALEESRQRVYSMARLQDHLHHGRSEEPVRMTTFLNDVVTALARAYGHPAIQVCVEAGDVLLEMERANSVGLIVNELVTNAFKHAFPDERQGRIAVNLEEIGENYRLRVRDTGVGFLYDRNLERNSSFGLRLVHLLVRRLDGTLSIEATAGTQFTVIFPVKVKL
jgi:PAS domain S-box-containing protein